MSKSSKNILVIFSFILLITGCSKKDLGTCGDPKLWKAHKQTLHIYYTEYNSADSMRTVFLEDISTPDDICSDNHPHIFFDVAVHDTSYSILWKSRAYWRAGLYESFGELGYTGVNQSAVSESMTPGLKQAYPGVPAEIGIQLLATFKSFGSDSLDRIMLYENISKADISLDYWLHK
jgi:hypothetical protein